jgi:cytochrome P450
MTSSTRCPHHPTASPSIISFQDRNPFPHYEDLRNEASVFWDEGLEGWILLSHELCRFVETNEHLFRTTYADASDLTKEVKGGEPISVLTGERHDRSRRFHMVLLSPGSVEEIRKEHIRPVINWLIDRFVDRGSADLTQELAYQIPPRMTLSLFGMDWRDDALVDSTHAHHNAIVEWIGRRNPTGEYAERALAASHALNELLLPQVRKQSHGEGGHFIARIWRDAPSYYDKVDEGEVLAICRELLFAGADTTMQALTNALYLLLTNSEAREAVRVDRTTALNNFVEEAFRLYPSAQWRFRIANQDIELDGTSIKKDDVVISVKAAANRDPEKYERPSELDITRPRATDHLTFNVGPRTCAGARLARTEMRDMVSVVIDRLPNLRLDPNAPLPRLSGVYMQGFRPLHVLFG